MYPIGTQQAAESILIIKQLRVDLFTHKMGFAVWIEA